MPYKDPEIKRLKGKAYNKKWYEKHPGKRAEINKRCRQRNAELWAEFKKTKRCTWCGEVEHYKLLDFHHVIRENKRKVEHLVKNSFKSAIKEVEEKCIPLCANHHRLLHVDPNFEKKVMRKVIKLGLFTDFTFCERDYD